MTIITTFAGRCLTCETVVEAGEEANWEPQVGIWHKDCRTPKNLALYKKEAARRANGFNDTPPRRV